MSLTYNGTELQSITWNGADVQTVTMDGVEVWSAIPADLSKATPAQIQYAAQHDLASSLWDIGDWFEMTLNGNWQCADNVISLSNYKIRCVLIGINHNASREGNHLLHFQMGKNTNNVDVAFYYSKMNPGGGDNSGGWKSCKMRTITMANLYNTIIPSNWRAVIKPCTKYTDNTAGGAYLTNTVTGTSDNCFLLAEYEVFGSRTYALSAEQNYQKQYAYYANGNSKVRYKHDSPTTVHYWLTRSARAATSYSFCYVTHLSTSDYVSTASEWSFSPAFCIG